MQVAGNAPSEKGRRAVSLTVRLDEDQYEGLRTMAFKERSSMNEIIREALACVLVGIRETDEGTYLIRFAALDIGIIDRKTKKAHRFGPKRPPRAKANINHPETVSDLSGLLYPVTQPKARWRAITGLLRPYQAEGDSVWRSSSPGTYTSSMPFRLRCLGPSAVT
jgi:hypothetical protein